MGPCHHSSNIVTCQDSSGGRGAASFGRSSSINVLLGGGVPTQPQLKNGQCVSSYNITCGYPYYGTEY